MSSARQAGVARVDKTRREIEATRDTNARARPQELDDRRIYREELDA